MTTTASRDLNAVEEGVRDVLVGASNDGVGFDYSPDYSFELEDGKLYAVEYGAAGVIIARHLIEVTATLTTSYETTEQL